MNTIEYADPATQRAAINPERQRAIDPVTHRFEEGSAKADRVIREAEGPRTYTRADRNGLSGFSGLDAAAYLFAAIMTLGPLLAGFMANRP